MATYLVVLLQFKITLLRQAAKSSLLMTLKNKILGLDGNETDTTTFINNET